MGPILALIILSLFPMGCLSQACRAVTQTPTIKENNAIGQVVTQLIVDPGHTVEVDPPFAIDGLNLILTVSVDYEVTQVLTVTLICKKDGLPESGQTIYVEIENENDNEPIFPASSYNFSISEDLQVNSAIGPAIKATDADQDILYYELISDDMAAVAYFRLSSQTNPVILVNKILDYDLYPIIKMNLTARDIVNAGDPFGHTATAAITVEINDADDKPPFFQPCTPYGTKACINNGYRSSVNRSEQATAPLHLTPEPLYAVDGDYGINATIAYTIISGNNDNVFAVNITSGSITMNKAIDRLETVLLQVMAFQTNDTLKYATTTVQIEVKEKNSFPPTFEKSNYHGNIPSGSEIRSFVLDSSNQNRPLQVFASDEDFPDKVNPAVTYKIENSSDFSVLREGYILTNTILSSPGIIVFLVTATDSATGENVSTIVTVEVTAVTTAPTTTSTTSTTWTTRSATIGTGTTTTPTTGTTTSSTTGTGTTTTTAPTTATTTSTTIGTGTTTTTAPTTVTTTSTTTGTGTTTTTAGTTQTTTTTTTGTGITTSTTPTTQTTTTTTTGTGTTTSTTSTTHTTTSTTTGTGTTTSTTPKIITTGATATETGSTTSTTPRTGSSTTKSPVAGITTSTTTTTTGTGTTTATTGTITTGTGTTKTSIPGTKTTAHNPLGTNTTTHLPISTSTIKSTIPGTGMTIHVTSETRTTLSNTLGTNNPQRTTPGIDNVSTGTSTSHSASTDGALEADRYYTVTDMAALGASLGIILALCLIGLGFLIYKQYGKIIRTRLGKSSGDNFGDSGGTGQLINNEDNSSITMPTNEDSNLGGMVNAEPLLSKENPFTAAAVSTVFSTTMSTDNLPSDTAEESDSKDNEVKSILTKEFKEDVGYKSVWFREDAAPEVVVIEGVEDGEADDNGTEEEFNNQQGDDDDDDEDDQEPDVIFSPMENDLNNISVL